MALIKFNPLFADLDALVAGGEWVPAVDIVERDHEVILKAELPGLEAKDVTIAVENNILTLRGARHTEAEVKKENFHRMERSYGAFNRSFALPATLDSDRVKADFKNGLLTITLPKKENVKARTIEVNVA